VAIPKIDARFADLLRQAGALEELEDGSIKSKIRVSCLHGHLFVHSAYPTEAEDAVFFGPDSYRFADLIASELQRQPLPKGAHIVDMGAGAGVGGIVAGLASANARITLTDLNPKALRLSRINARAAGISVETIEAETLEAVANPIDLAVINPPYIIDDSKRAYRDGGGMKGGEVPVQMAQMAADRIAPGGRVILYTGAAITEGQNGLSDRLAAYARNKGFRFSCRELDPDVFGEELEGPAYDDVERIALVGISLVRPD
jgi:methylase of polypeptide subunit release factors